MPNDKIDIYERIFNFILDVLRFIDNLPNTPSNLVIRNQITRSAPSMGANSQEADGTATKKDFLHCLTIVRKESKETVFWLRLADKLNPTMTIYAQPIIQEGNEIVAIISAIISKTISNSQNKL